MSNLTDEARENLQRMTEIPAEVYIWTGVAVLVLSIVAALTTGESAADRAERVRQARELENRRTLDHVTRCNDRHDGMWCDRAENHAGNHADSRTGRDYPVQWRNLSDMGGAA